MNNGSYSLELRAAPCQVTQELASGGADRTIDVGETLAMEQVSFQPVADKIQRAPESSNTREAWARARKREELQGEAYSFVIDNEPRIDGEPRSVDSGAVHLTFSPRDSGSGFLRDLVWSC
jgi:hypothetical protein